MSCAELVKHELKCGPWVDTWHDAIGGKSQSRGIRKSKQTNDGLTCGMRGQVLLTQALPTGFGRRKKRRQKKREGF